MGSLSWRMTPHAYAWRTGDRRPDEGAVPGMLVEGVAHATAAGYDGIEAGLPWVAQEPVASAIGAYLAERGLALEALFASVRLDADESAVRRVAAQASAARSCGFRFLNVVTVPSPAQRARVSPTFDGAPDEVADVLGRVAAALDGIELCWHPHDVSLRDDGAAVAEVLDRADLGLCVDLGWVARAGVDPVKLLERFPAAVRTLHVRDLHAGGSWCEAVGEGELDLAAISEALGRLGFDGPTAVELMFERSTTVTRKLPDNADRSARALRGHRFWQDP